MGLSHLLVTLESWQNLHAERFSKLSLLFDRLGALRHSPTLSQNLEHRHDSRAFGLCLCAANCQHLLFTLLIAVAEFLQAIHLTLVA